MRGYKGMAKDMTCRGMKFEIGKTYHIAGKIEICRNGLHFCKNLKDVFNYYANSGGNRFFEVEASENILERKDKCVTDELTIVRELSEVEVNRNFYGDGYGNCYGNGNGNGNGNGYGNGDGYGNGNGNGYGNGNGNGNGNGYGNGNGNGYGYGNGDGYGYGYGIHKILKFN